MSRAVATHYTIRDDREYTVVVGWEAELESFYACVFPAASHTGEPLLAVGEEWREITTVARLARAVAGYARLDTVTAAALRDDASAAAQSYPAVAAPSRASGF